MHHKSVKKFEILSKIICIVKKKLFELLNKVFELMILYKITRIIMQNNLY